MGRLGDIPSDVPLSVDIFLIVMPIFMLVSGLLALYAAFTLWGGSQRGFFAALGVLGLWILEELILLVWGVVGPDIVQRSTDVFGNMVRILVAIALMYYLVQRAEGFVFESSTGGARGQTRW